MKKIIIISFLIASVSLVSQAFAAEGLIKPASRLYFLQTWGESIRLLFTFSKEKKLDYLFELADRRVDEMKDVPSAAIADRYENHFQDLSNLVSEIENREEVAERIEEASLRQQEVLSGVYAKVPDEAKDAILNAQENSSKNVAQVLEVIEGAEKAQEYVEQVAQIQQAGKMERAERIERASMEGSPNAEPSQGTPRELKEGRELNPLEGPKSLNPILPGQGGESGGAEQAEPVAPAPMEEPTGQQ